MHGYVGVTDDQWYHFLAARPEMDRPQREFLEWHFDEVFKAS